MNVMMTDLWRIVTDHPDIFDTHIVPRSLTVTIFFYDVNIESRAAIKRSGVHLAVAFKIRYFDTKSTLSWALEKCTKKQRTFLCRNGSEWKLGPTCRTR